MTRGILFISISVFLTTLPEEPCSKALVIMGTYSKSIIGRGGANEILGGDIATVCGCADCA